MLNDFGGCPTNKQISRHVADVDEEPHAYWFVSKYESLQSIENISKR